MLKITEMRVVGSYLLDLRFNEGTSKIVNVRPLLWGPVFEPLRDFAYFARAMLDPRSGVVMWPNEADFAPEALYDLPAEEISEIERSVAG